MLLLLGGAKGDPGESGAGSKNTPYHAMISRINQLESRLAVLDNPDHKQVNEDTMIIKEHGGKGIKPVSDMWTLLQTQRRSQSNEEMITKVVLLFPVNQNAQKDMLTFFVNKNLAQD